jgi:hypothetical protein
MCIYIYYELDIALKPGALKLVSTDTGRLAYWELHSSATFTCTSRLSCAPTPIPVSISRRY